MVVPSILMLVNPRASAQHCLSRAVMLARYLRWRLHLVCGVLGDQAESGYRQYMTSLRASIVAPDIEITSEICVGRACEERIFAAARERGCLLIIKSPERARFRQVNSADARLLRRAPVPVLLTHGEPWAPHPYFAAAITRTRANRQRDADCKAIVDVATALRVACHAGLDLIEVQESLNSLGAQAAPARERASPGSQTRESMSKLIGSRAYDLLVVGAPESRAGAISMTDDLVMAHSTLWSACDLLVTSANTDAGG